MNKKALFFDYDGTIISDQSGQIPKSVYKVFEALKKEGHYLFLNTGRTKAILDTTLNTFPFDGMILGCGSYIEYQKEVLYEVDVDKEKHDKIKALINDCHVDAFYEGTHALYLSHGIQANRLLRLLEKYRDADVAIKSIDEMEHDFVKMFVCLQDLEKESIFKKGMEELFEYIDRGQQSVELIAKGHSKATGIQFMMDKLKIKKEDCYTFGDSNNDLPMFRFIKNSALIGNDNESLHKEVAYVSKSVDEDGLKEAIEYFQLVKTTV